MRHICRLLSEYYDKELHPVCCRRIEKHLAACQSCLAELEQMKRLSDVLAECALPDVLSRAETFRARVALRLPRRKVAQARGASWVWYAVPLSLLCVLVSLQALVVLSGSIGPIATVAGWIGVDVSAMIDALTSGLIGRGTLLSDLTGSSSLTSIGVLWYVSVFLVSFLIFVPYVGWVSVLRRTAPHLPAALKGE